MRIKPMKKIEVKDNFSKDLKKLFIGGQYPIPMAQGQQVCPINGKDPNALSPEKKQELIQKVNNQENSGSKEKKVSKEKIGSISSYDQNFGGKKKLQAANNSEGFNVIADSKEDKKIQKASKHKIQEVIDNNIKNIIRINNKSTEKDILEKIQEDDKELEKLDKNNDEKENNNTIRQSNLSSGDTVKKRKKKNKTTTFQETKENIIDLQVLKVDSNINNPEYKKNLLNKNKIEDFLNEELTASKFFKQVI